MKAVLGNKWSKDLKRRIDAFEFEVGVLDDKPHKQPIETGLFDNPQLGSYAGGPVRRMSRRPGESTVGDVLVENMQRLNINILQKPFKKKNADILKFTNYFLKLVLKRPGITIKRVENLLQAIVRNPILKEEYGSNNFSTANSKGFNRHLFDTGQMFKAIRARVVRAGGK